MCYNRLNDKILLEIEGGLLEMIGGGGVYSTSTPRPARSRARCLHLPSSRLKKTETLLRTTPEVATPGARPGVIPDKVPAPAKTRKTLKMNS